MVATSPLQSLFVSLLLLHKPVRFRKVVNWNFLVNSFFGMKVFSMKIVTWNLNNRRSNPEAWQSLFELRPDIALLSEVNHVPEDLKDYDAFFEFAVGHQKTLRNFKTGLLVRGKIIGDFELHAKHSWINEALSVFTGNFVSKIVELRSGEKLAVISVHMPSWQFQYENFTSDDVSDVMLPNYSKMYMSELLWSALKNTVPERFEDFVVGGDFNTSEFIGNTKRTHDANKAAIQRMLDLGFAEAVRSINGGPVPTWRSPRKNTLMKHQLDHLYVSGSLRKRLSTARVGDQENFFGRNLSDHLPVIADFTAMI